MPSTPPWTLHPVYADGAAGADVGYLYSKGRAAVHGGVDGLSLIHI